MKPEMKTESRMNIIAILLSVVVVAVVAFAVGFVVKTINDSIDRKRAKASLGGRVASSALAPNAKLTAAVREARIGLPDGVRSAHCSFRHWGKRGGMEQTFIDCDTVLGGRTIEWSEPVPDTEQAELILINRLNFEVSSGAAEGTMMRTNIDPSKIPFATAADIIISKTRNLSEYLETKVLSKQPENVRKTWE